jgi:purine-cytosine permease-like protein
MAQIGAMAAHVQLAILVAGTISCLVHLFGGMFTSDEWFYPGPLALLAMIPVAAKRPRTQTTTVGVWLLALIFVANFIDEQMFRSGKADLLEILEWAMLIVILRAFHRRPLTAAAR